MKTDDYKLPDLDDFKPIPREQVEEFRKNGHTITKGLLSPEEIAAYHLVIKKSALKYNTEKRKIEDRDTYGKAFLQIMNLWRFNESVKKFVMSRRLAKVAADLLGVENVRIYHDQALFKEPGGGLTPWHQDQYYWPVDTDKTITMWMPLVNINAEMGMIRFASGSHKNGSLFNYEISDKSDSEFNTYVKKNNFKVNFAKAMKAGDASWHSGFTIHNATANTSNKMREVFTIIYIPSDVRIKKPENQWQKNDLKTWLMDKEPGAFADSELNPLVL